MSGLMNKCRCGAMKKVCNKYCVPCTDEYIHQVRLNEVKDNGRL